MANESNSVEQAEVFDELPLWSSPFGIKLLDKINYRRDISILDIGFSTGFPIIELSARFGRTCTIYGIDPWTAGIKRTLKKIQFYGIKNIQIIKGSAEKIPLNENSINLITSNNGLNNVNQLNKALQECSRVIKRGGQFVQAFNLDSTMKEFYEELEKLLRELNMSVELKKMKEHIYKKRIPLDEILNKLEENGFSIKEIEHSMFEYKFIDGTSMLNHHFIKLAFLNEWENIINVEKQRQIFKELENRINKISGSKGFFKLTIPFVIIDSEKK